MITNFQSILVCFEGAVVGSNLSQLPEIPFGKLLSHFQHGLGLGSADVTAFALPKPRSDDSKRLYFSPHVHVRFGGRHQR
jgi:hypothetical protein